MPDKTNYERAKAHLEYAERGGLTMADIASRLAIVDELKALRGLYERSIHASADMMDLARKLRIDADVDLDEVAEEVRQRISAVVKE